MNGRWFRLYDDAVHDPKVQALPPRLFKFWINILCITSKNDGVIPPLGVVVTTLKSRCDVVEAFFSDLKNRGLIDQIEGCLEPHNWRKRQYKSDTSAERMRHHRQRKSDVTVTPPETETDTDRVSEDTNSRASELFQEFWKAFPKRDGDNPKPKAQAKFTKLVEAGINPAMLIAAAHRCAEQNRETELRYIPMAITWLNEQRWDDAKPQPELPTIKPGQPEWDAWERYYREHKKPEPLAMQRVRAGQQQAMTVPTKLPEQADASYASAIELKRRLDRRAS